MAIYLYKKTHNKSGLQYLGKTTEGDPHKYHGSGKDWVPHIKEHGYDVSTEILRECLTKEELSYWGRYYSKLWNIVEDPKWANRIPETGGGIGGDVSEYVSQIWYVSRVDDPTEIQIKNIAAWCREHRVDETVVSNLTNPTHCLFQKQTKGWRFRKEGQSILSPYVNKRLTGHPNIACKGKSWKLIEGKRVWFAKGDNL